MKMMMMILNKRHISLLRGKYMQ